MTDVLTPMEVKKALLAGCEEKIADEHKKGKLTSRERIARVLDAGSFMETNVFMKRANAACCSGEDQAGESVITGYGTVDGRPVYVYAQDFTVMSGALGQMHAKKICNVYDAAMKTGVPVLAIMDTAGARIEEGMSALDGYAQIYKRSVDASGLIPQIALVCGPCPGAAAFAAALCDFTIVVDKNGAVFGRGPQVISAAEGKQVSAQDLGGAMVSSEKSGLAQIFATNEDDGIAKARMLLKLLPSNNLEDAPADLCEDDLNRECPALNGYVAGESDMHLTVEAIADAGSVLEIMPYYALNMVTALATVNGRSVGIIGNNPADKGGIVDIAAADKAARFIRVCDSFNLPLIVLVDSMGLPVELKQEHGGLIRHGAKLIYALAEASTAKVVVVAGHAIGSAYSLMASKSLGMDMVYAWPLASISAVEPEAAATLLYEKEIAASANPIEARSEYAKQYAAEQGGALRAAELGLVDDVIEPALTRPVVASALELLWSKRENRLPKKHGNMPL